MRKLLRSILIGSTALAAQGAYAQDGTQSRSDTADADASVLEEIIVTAQKRAESIQDVPAAITALTGANLETRQITNIASLVSAVPNVDFGTYGGVARIAVRGIGFDTINPGAEGRIAYHVDGVYISRPSATVGTFFDVERVEVLRGPQGTLYGRNATGGSINVITRAPTNELDGYLRVGYGNYDQITTAGAIGGPLTEGVRARIAFNTEDRDGYGRNIVTGRDIDNAQRRGVRGALSFDLSTSATIDLTADYYHENDRSYGNHFLGQGNAFVQPIGLVLGGQVPADRRDIANPIDPRNDRTFWGLAARAEIDLGGPMLRSITGYRDSQYEVRTDLDATSAPLSTFFFREKARQISQEFQLAKEEGTLQYLAGLYYFDEKITGGSVIPFDIAILGLPSFFAQGYAVFGDTHTKAAAAFGQVDYALSDQFTVTAGARYSWEKKHIDDLFQFDLARPYSPTNPFSPLLTREDSTTNKAFTPKLGLEYRPHDDLMLYATVSKGFKSGGFNLGDTQPAYDPEEIWAYEAGLKGTWADGRVRMNIAGFYYDYTNLQVSKVVGTQIVVENAASSIVYGMENEITIVPVDNFQVDIAAAWLHSKYKGFVTADPARPELVTPENPTGAVVLDGNQLTQAPALSVNVGAEYRLDVGDGRLSLRGEVNYQDRVYFTPFNIKAVSRPANTKINAFLTYEGANWTASLWGRNLTNKTTIGNALINSGLFGFPITGTLDPPRTYGIEIGYRF